MQFANHLLSPVNPSEYSLYYTVISLGLCHIIIHTMSHHHTCYVTSSYHIHSTALRILPCEAPVPLAPSLLSPSLLFPSSLSPSPSSLSPSLLSLSLSPSLSAAEETEETVSEERRFQLRSLRHTLLDLRQVRSKMKLISNKMKLISNKMINKMIGNL